VARPLHERPQCRAESAGPLVEDRERCLEAAAAAWSGSTPIVWGDRIFLNVADDLKSGMATTSPLVRRPHEGHGAVEAAARRGNHQERKQNMSTPSPVTDGTLVWVMTGTGILKAFDFSGVEKWSRDIPKDYGRFGLNWGYGSSPLLHGDALYVQVLHGMRTDDPSYVLRIDKATGKTVWRVERPTRARFESPDSYTTPALLRTAPAPRSS
jgi:outer membrane protein assembly factor BamB